MPVNLILIDMISAMTTQTGDKIHLMPSPLRYLDPGHKEQTLVLSRFIQKSKNGTESSMRLTCFVFIKEKHKEAKV